MQIDFHHTVTYILARIAGFEHDHAVVIAHSAQYVDDAVFQGTLTFSNGAMYSHINSAHKLLDYRNFERLADHHVWVPFHFLPGNITNDDTDFYQKIICRPNSMIAQEMVNACVQNQNTWFSLHQLGITMHVYADTWAHQGFAGVIHEENNIRDIKILDDQNNKNAFDDQLKRFFGDIFDDVKSTFVGTVSPLGHGAALTCPDQPYLKWQYTDCNGKIIKRDNTEIFIDACEAMYHVMSRYIQQDINAKVNPFPIKTADALRRCFKQFNDPDARVRHPLWLKAIQEGQFGFPGVSLHYVDQGSGAWKYDALGKDYDQYESHTFLYQHAFLKSNWKLFHDALQFHRLTIINQILPKYGMCLA